MATQESFAIASVQAVPVFLDKERTIEKACALIREAGARGAQLAVFPESFVPGYPVWAWHVPAVNTHVLRAAYTEFHAHSIEIPGEETARLGDAARAAGVTVAIGVSERNSEAAGTTLFNTLLYIGSDGRVLGRHRKLIPTGGERLVWGRGDGSDLVVYQLPFGKLGGLICWENYMPLARFALAAMGMNLLAAPTWDRGEPWLSTMRHSAKETRSFVLSACSPLTKTDVLNRLGYLEPYFSGLDERLNPGDSVIVDPDGKPVAGPVKNDEVILYAEVNPAQLVGPRWQLDISGHYSRPDVFRLFINRSPMPQLRFAEPTGRSEPPDSAEIETSAAD